MAVNNHQGSGNKRDWLRGILLQYLRGSCCFVLFYYLFPEVAGPKLFLLGQGFTNTNVFSVMSMNNHMIWFRLSGPFFVILAYSRSV